jgi:hypothetical protein
MPERLGIQVVETNSFSINLISLMPQICWKTACFVNFVAGWLFSELAKVTTSGTWDYEYVNSAFINELPSRRTSHTLVLRMPVNICSKDTKFEYLGTRRCLGRSWKWKASRRSIA